MRILCNRLDRGFLAYQQEFEDKVIEVMRSGYYVLGKEVQAFEEEFARYLGTSHCIGVGSGLSALEMAFHLLDIGPGDEVIVPANTYIASVLGITLNGAVPVFVEPDEYYNIDGEEKVVNIAFNIDQDYKEDEGNPCSSFIWAGCQHG